jgi:hypothetical protein
MVADAIKKNGYTGDGIRRGIAGLKDFKSIGGGVVAIEERQSLLPVALYQIKEVSKPELVEITP